MPSGDGLMDYLRGRGGKIKELEDELAQARSRCERLQQELSIKNEAVTLLTAENKALKVTAITPVTSATSSALEHLNQKLDDQLHKALLLEQDLAAAKQREAVSMQRLTALEALLADQRTEQARLLAEAETAAARLRMDLEAARAEAKMATQKAELAERVAQRRVEAEHEVLKVAHAQLDELRAQMAGMKGELEQARQRAARQEAEAAALRSSAQHVRMQLLEEELRNAREALAAAQAAATADAGRLALRASAGSGPGPAQPALQQQQLLTGAAATAGLGVGAVGSSGSAGGGMLTADGILELPKPLNDTWAAVMQALSVPQGLPLAAQAAEAGRAAAALAQEAADLRASVKNHDEALMQLRAAASGSEAYASELQSQLADARSRLERALTAERVAERRAAAIEQERDALRAALSSTAAAAGVDNPGSLSGRLLAGQQAAAVEQLQQLNDALTKQVASLQQEVAASASAAEAQALATRAATSRAEAAELRLKQLEREADGLATEERLGRGELIRAGGVRVLHLRHNPEVEAKQSAREAAVTQLAAENEALRAQVSEMEAALAQLRREVAGGAAGDGTQPAAAGGAAPVEGGSVALAVKEAEVTVLRRKVEECEKAMNRLKAVFKERITVFRYTGGQMELVPNAFTQGRLVREVETFVRKFNCIPALTANLTMENFQKQTQC
ncbi:hypothetical protein GPECTOR_130g571 [Gonium pectorale]|uniref:Uncharacterized protein n=1 Tax=Gonium pectorale TaxID=33097 RepID=A0A150FZW1_GONPE|nr:hypothetical protein GPECTOR_130g571 [Gonium pectorale]|eukprot:KXZ42610.1 hypothetical protein GPECTOR_130g571 [Gonium pectorale]